jgi:ATP-dependent exoDNAse (exonuclease V) beta subunit
VLLEAGAGSGKTRVLVERYCNAVEHDGVDVDRLLAFTFTERAAAELRQRVRRELTRRAAAAREAGDADTTLRLADAARDTERAWVMTIHGFCRRLLAAHSVAAGLDPRFRVLAEAEASRLRQRAVGEAVDELILDGDRDVAWASAAYRWRLPEMAIVLHERLRNLGEARPSIPDVPDAAAQGEEAELSPAEAERAARAHEALAAVLDAFRDRYVELKGARSGLDFADLELLALELLQGSDSVRDAWHGRFEHVMVDEFQDTNRVQLRLVAALRGENTRVFRVGDEHQSIYRFRNADLEVFREERRRAIADPGSEVLPLRGNFRSRAPVLGLINTVGHALLPDFEPLAHGRDDEPDGEARAELLLTLEAGKGEPKWSDFEEELALPPSARNATIVAEARALARRLRQLVDEGGAARGEIVVLLRAFTHVDAYEDALQRAGLDPYVVGGRGYWSQQQVEDLLCLLGTLANPLDDEALFGALASPACGASPDALWLLRRAAGERRHVWPTLSAWLTGGDPGEGSGEWLDAVPRDDVERLRRFHEIHAELRAEAPVRALDELVERTMDAFGYDLALLSRPGGPGRMANVRKLMRLAREFEEHEGRSLRGFLAAAADSTERDEREGMAPVQAEGHDGVRIMTVHASKGLEFPVVAVPDLGRRLSAGHQGGDVAVARDPDHDRPRFGMRLATATAASTNLWGLTELLDEEKIASAEENCRLVYVAATRARDRLILSGCFRREHAKASDPKPGDSPLGRLLPALAAEDGHLGSGTLELPAAPELGDGGGAPSRLEVRVNEPGPERAAELAALAGARARGAADDAGPLSPPLLGELPRPTPVGHLSYSALAGYERCGYRFYVERVIGLRSALPQAASEAEDDPAEPDESDEVVDPGALPAPTFAARHRSLAVGNAVHAALEWSAREGWASPSGERLASLLAAEGLGGDAEAQERARSLVEGWLGSGVRAELDGHDVRPEAPFALSLAGSIVRGKMDLLTIGPGALTVVDFKTDALNGAAPEELGGRYSVQRAVYALAAAGSRGGDATVRAVHLFLESPERPVVEEFGAAELAAAREQLEAIIQRIRDGAFAPTESPEPAICFGCPAAARLCPHPRWRPPE